MSQASERLKVALQEIGIEAKRSLGQNFLISDTVIGKIIDQVREFAPEVMIEVGPGPGALTHFLKDMGVPLHLIELDRTIAAYWRGQGLDVQEQDALQMDWQPYYSDRKTVFVSNLPYQISSSIVIERSLETRGVEAMVLMFQKEVAQRIRAPAKSEHYGMLSVIAQNFWKTWLVSEAGPRDFDPPPRVASRVLGFSRIEPGFKDRQKFLTFVKVSFAQRRKLLKKNLSSLLDQKQITEEQLVSWLAEMGFKETARAEELSPEQFANLYKRFGFE
jgi:dimethyladenosine transferase